MFQAVLLHIFAFQNDNYYNYFWLWSTSGEEVQFLARAILRFFSIITVIEFVPIRYRTTHSFILSSTASYFVNIYRLKYTK